MPIRWTPDNDQLLLLKILETHDLAVDAKKISAAWPTDKGEVPTARAITERLVKIRSNVRNNGMGHFGITSAQTKVSSGSKRVSRKQTTPGRNSSPAHDLQRTRMSSRSQRPNVYVKPEVSDDATENRACEDSMAQQNRITLVSHTARSESQMSHSKHCHTGGGIAPERLSLVDSDHEEEVTRRPQPTNDVDYSYIV